MMLGYFYHHTSIIYHHHSIVIQLSSIIITAPNVGKSSIVRAVSSGTPEVNDYPFTTRELTDDDDNDDDDGDDWMTIRVTSTVFFFCYDTILYRWSDYRSHSRCRERNTLPSDGHPRATRSTYRGT